MPQPFLAGNWKMHLSGAEVDAFCAALRDAGLPDGVTAGVFPGFLHLERAVAALEGTGWVVGAQTCRPESHGAFTGEVSITQIQDAGASHVIVGHSERRHVFGETDAQVRQRLDAVLAHGLSVVLCVGETLDERQAGRTGQVVLGQLDAGTAGLSGAELVERVTVAYEPVWAIGTGQVATPAQAQEVHADIRARLAATFGNDVAQQIVIQYGGSVKPGNVAELLTCPDVNGALVGGASLQSDSFLALVAAGAVSRSGVNR